MKIKEAIDLVDELKPNQYDEKMKIMWLSKLDGMIFAEMLMTHEGCGGKTFYGYDNALPDQELLVPYPYDKDIYNYFLQSQIDKENGEIVKYNQNAMLFDQAYQAFANYYHRTHMPVSCGKHFRF